MNFYANHLAAQDNGALPRAVTSALDGRLGMFEDRLAALLYKHSVELDMVMGILADSYEFTEEDMRRRRADSVHNVKQTNGRLSFEQKVRSDGKKHARNVYAHSEEDCEKLLAEMIAEMKAEIAAEKERLAAVSLMPPGDA